MQEELIKSEEERLTISQALLTMQLDLNRAQVSLAEQPLHPTASGRLNAESCTSSCLVGPMHSSHVAANMQEEAVNIKYTLEQKILELEDQASSSSSSSAVSTPSSGQRRQTAAAQQQQEALKQQELEQSLARQQQMADLQKQNEALLSSR